METLGSFVARESEAILQDWEKFARSLVPEDGLDSARLRDHAKDILLAVVDDIQRTQTDREQTDKGKGLAPDNSSLTRAAHSHAVSRMADQFTLNQVVAEFRAMRASVLRRWAATHASGDAGIAEVTRFNEAIDEALAASMSHYQTKLEEARAVILGVLAHDLRNPLNAISIGAQLILRSASLDPKTAQVAARTLNSVSRMKGLVQDLLDYTLTRLGTGLPVMKTPGSVEHIVREVISEVEAAHPDRTIVCTASGDFAGEWDAARIAQLFTNLLTNALNHGDPDQPVQVALRDTADEVVVQVFNQGPPIPESARSALFQPLKHLPHQAPSLTRGSSGLGLGLYTAQEIAKAHQGRVELVSSDESGTVFAVSLPKKDDRHQASPAVQQRPSFADAP